MKAYAQSGQYHNIVESRVCLRSNLKSPTFGLPKPNIKPVLKQVKGTGNQKVENIMIILDHFTVITSLPKVGCYHYHFATNKHSSFHLAVSNLSW